MGFFDELLHHLRCSLHPQLRHYAPEALRDLDDFRHHLDYWNLPECFRRKCDEAFQKTGTIGYFHWQGRCLFSFDTLSPPCSHAVLLRNVFVPKKHRGKHSCTEALSQIVRVAESCGICILAIVHPFEIRTDKDDIEAGVEALHRSAHDVWYVSSQTAQAAMNARLRKAGFLNFDMRDSMSEHGATTIPLTNQWIFVPQGVDQAFLASIQDRFVNEVVHAPESIGIST